MNDEVEYWKQLAMVFDELYSKSFQDLSECWNKSWRLEMKVAKWQVISELLLIILIAETVYFILK